MAMEFNATYRHGIVTIEIENILTAYAEIRTLFAFIQNWKSVSATYNGKPVHPYQFILNAHWIGDCYDARGIDKNCGTGWECMKIDNLRYHIPGVYYKSHKFWYQHGKWDGYKWIVDKKKILSLLMEYAETKGITACPFFDETKLQRIVHNLPAYLVADNVTFEMVFKENILTGN